MRKKKWIEAAVVVAQAFLVTVWLLDIRLPFRDSEKIQIQRVEHRENNEYVDVTHLVNQVVLAQRLSRLRNWRLPVHLYNFSEGLQYMISIWYDGEPWDIYLGIQDESIISRGGIFNTGSGTMRHGSPSWMI